MYTESQERHSGPVENTDGRHEGSIHKARRQRGRATKRSDAVANRTTHTCRCYRGCYYPWGQAWLAAAVVVVKEEKSGVFEFGAEGKVDGE